MYIMYLTLTLVEVELLVGRSVSFDVHEVAGHVRVVQSREGHVCRGRGHRRRRGQEGMRTEKGEGPEEGLDSFF